MWSSTACHYRLDEPDEYGDLWGTRPWREVFRGNSRCSSCGAPVRFYDNVPVASYVVLLGRCRNCRARIAGYHPLVELAAPVAFVLAVWSLGVTWLLAPALWFIPVALAVAVIDLRTLIVPTAIVWPVHGSAAGAVGRRGGAERRVGPAVSGLVGVAVVAGPLFLLWFAVPSGMGFGDVRLSVSAGWLVGFYAGVRPLAALPLGVITLLAASVLGLVLGVVALGVRGRGAKVPFGPSFVASAFAVALLAPQILEPWKLYAT